LLDMPPVELPGDHDMPRVQDGVIFGLRALRGLPGHESEAYLHLPAAGAIRSRRLPRRFMAVALGTPLPFLRDRRTHAHLTPK